MSGARYCCCSDTCSNPTGTHTIASTFAAIASKTDSTQGTDTRVQTFDYLQDLTLNGSGATILDTSTARIRTHRTLDWTVPDGSGGTIVLGRFDRKLDATLTVAGPFDGGTGVSHTCGDCGVGDAPASIYTYGPNLRTPHKFGSSGQILSVTVNSYTNTATSPNTTPSALGFVVTNSDSVNPGSVGSYIYTYDGSNIGQQTFGSAQPPHWEPLRVWRSGKTSGNPTNVCLPQWTIWDYIVTSGSGSGVTNRPLCPGDKTALEADGFTFSTYTRTASIT